MRILLAHMQIRTYPNPYALLIFYMQICWNMRKKCAHKNPSVILFRFQCVIFVSNVVVFSSDVVYLYFRCHLFSNVISFISDVFFVNFLMYFLFSDVFFPGGCIFSLRCIFSPMYFFVHNGVL